MSFIFKRTTKRSTTLNGKANHYHQLTIDLNAFKVNVFGKTVGNIAVGMDKNGWVLEANLERLRD